MPAFVFYPRWEALPHAGEKEKKTIAISINQSVKEGSLIDRLDIVPDF